MQKSFCHALFLGSVLLLTACQKPRVVDTPPEGPLMSPDLAATVLADTLMDEVLDRGRTIVRDGFNAGDGYAEVWIRDLNTFIELSLEVLGPEPVRDNLRVFFETQASDGNIVDGFMPADGTTHKNTVETDQETSLVQAVHAYVALTGDVDFLAEEIDGESVMRRMERAMQFLLDERWADRYGLLWGATTTDWGDVQPEHEWGVDLDENTHYAVDIYDNAMFVIALDNLSEMLERDEERAQYWSGVKTGVEQAIRNHLWKDGRFIPHLYLQDSPWPDDFDEGQIYYHGGTAVAILAGLLTGDEIAASLSRMRDNVRKSGAATIGLTLYPAYPDGFFKNPGMGAYSYQNGGDWTWFGGRMIQALVAHGFYQDAYDELRPMLERVRANDGFFEWYTVDNEPRGSGVFRGSAGVLAKAIYMLREEAVRVLP
jgi:cellobiose phosphorylase